ncbi:MAG TPA: hypothetical protein VH436_23260 [Vicinamibacterales bacterium]
MKTILYLLRFFRVASPLPGLVVWTFGAIVAGAGAIVVLMPSRTAGALAPLLVLQMFAASSGFAVPGRRGHYDLLLTRTGGRLSIALAHWVNSIAPGVAGWLIVASVEALTTGSTSIAMASGTCAAVALVSTIPWAATVALPRFSGGIGWLLLLTIAGITLSPSDHVWLPGEAEGFLAGASAFLLYPIAIVGRRLSAGQLLMALPALTLAAASMAAACGWVRRATFPLEAAQ